MLSLSLIQKGIVLPVCGCNVQEVGSTNKGEVVHNVTCFRSDTCFGQAGGSTLPIGVAIAFFNFLVIGWGFSNVKFDTNPGCDRFLKPVRVTCALKMWKNVVDNMSIDGMLIQNKKIINYFRIMPILNDGAHLLDPRPHLRQSLRCSLRHPQNPDIETGCFYELLQLSEKLYTLGIKFHKLLR